MSDYHDGLHLIPAHMHGGVQRYVEQGILPGSFLTALLCNDFMDACGRADEDNARVLHQWAQFFHNYMPRGSFGSPDRVKAWAKEGGLHQVQPIRGPAAQAEGK